MTKKIITYSHCAVCFACASLFVEGAATVQVFQDVSQFPTEHARDYTISLESSGFGGRPNNKLIFAYAFEEDGAGWNGVTVKLRDNDSVEHDFSSVVNTQGGRAAGLFYLDISNELAAEIGGSDSALIVDFGVHSDDSGDVKTQFSGVLMSVSGLASSGAAYSAYQASSDGDGTHDHPDANGTDHFPGTSTYEIGFTGDADDMFVATAFTTNSLIPT